MNRSDIDELERKAAIGVCQALGWPEYAATQINRNSPLFGPIFGAMVLEKAAQVCDGIDQSASSNAPVLCAMRIRGMAAGLQSGETSGALL